MAEPNELDDHVLPRPAPPLGWRERLERLADSTGSTPGRLAAGAAVLIAAVVGGLWLTRPPTQPPEVDLPFATTTAFAAAVSSTTDVPQHLVVHVAGAVLQPGVHELEPAARVIDAVNAAGGLAPQADGARINLAAPVADGERVYVPAAGEPTPPAVVGTAGSNGSAAPVGPLDLNAATEAQLDELPGVGPATAAAIVEHRDRIGGFTSVDQLLDVRGIGDAKFDQLRPLVQV